MELYIEGFVKHSGNNYELNLGPSSKCALMLCKYPNELRNVNVSIVVNDSEYSLLNSDAVMFYEHKLRQLGYCAKIVKFSSLSDDFKSVDFPLATCSSKILIYSGAAAVFRIIVQFGYEPGTKIPIFGKAQSCLKACKERSKWTLMCEKSIVETIESFHNDSDSFNDEFFRDLNVSFLVDKANELSSTKLDVKSRKYAHKFLEGPHKTLTDIVIGFYLLDYSQRNWKLVKIVEAHRLVVNWLAELKLDSLDSIVNNLNFIPISWVDKQSRLPINERYNFSITDGIQKLKISNKNMPELKDLISSDVISALKIDIDSVDGEPLASDFDLSFVPEGVRPSHSPIPEARQLKKTYQVWNMIHRANQLIRPGMTIVDFCSGGGHLGMMLAALRRDCRVVLLENKEESLQMAEARIRESGLDNVRLIKCNILAFKGHFDVGLALHACGCVTDLVIEICLSRKAHMVISPCCYGSIVPTANIDYPRSGKFSANVSLDVYSKLCHGADCFTASADRILVANEAMNLVDSDRCHYVAEHGYSTKIFRMKPADCTPKNHILFMTKI